MNQNGRVKTKVLRAHARTPNKQNFITSTKFIAFLLRPKDMQRIS